VYGAEYEWVVWCRVLGVWGRICVVQGARCMGQNMSGLCGAGC
jgi:hypothetical protein